MTMKQIWGRLSGRSDALTCRQVGRLVQSHLDDELVANDTRRVAEHLEACRRCGLEAETYAQIIAALEAGQPVGPARLERLRAFGAELAAGRSPS